MTVATGCSSSLDAFLASCPDMLFIAGVDGALLQWSASLSRAVGPAFTGGRFMELAHPDDRAELAAAWDHVVGAAKAARVRVRLPCAGGAHQRFRCGLVLSPGGAFVHGSLDEEGEYAALLDELAELRSQARILRALMENVSICVWTIDTKGTFTYHDGKGLERAGMRRSQLVGQNIFETYRGDGIDAVRRALAGAFVHNATFTHGRHWETWHVPARDERGATVGVIGFTLDVSDAKEAEEELRAKLALIEQQQQVIRDLSTPILEVWNGVLALPMIGVVDSVRVSEMTEALLSRIVEKSARFVILDLTGVEVVDTKVAGHLVSIVNAIRLLGAEGVVTGIQPMVAQTMVALGLDLSSIVTRANLRAGLGFCIRQMTSATRSAPSSVA